MSIDHEKGGTINIPAEHSLFPGDIEISIPPRAIPGSGATEISITRSIVSLSYASGKFYPSPDDSPILLICEPSGLVLNEQIKVEFDIQNFDYNTEQIHQMVYLEKKGSGEISMPYSDRKEPNITIDEENGKAIVYLPHFSLIDWEMYSEGNFIFFETWRYFRHDIGNPFWTPRYCAFSAPVSTPVTLNNESWTLVTEILGCTGGLFTGYITAYCNSNMRYQIGNNGSICCFDISPIISICCACGSTESATIGVEYDQITTRLLSISKTGG